MRLLTGANNFAIIWILPPLFKCPGRDSKPFHGPFISDPDADEENQKKKGSDQYDPLFKIKPLFEDLVPSCKTFYQPDRHITIHERVVATKDPVDLKQDVERNSPKCGYKLFVLTDSLSGYTWACLFT